MADFFDLIETDDRWVDYGYQSFPKPIGKTKFLLVSWRMSGSEFVKELIRENFPELIEKDIWGKSHKPICSEVFNQIKNAKIIFVLADPRDVAAHIAFYEDGLHCDSRDYTAHAFNNKRSIEFIEENFKKINDLMSFFSNKFKNKFIVVKYEDAVYDQKHFLNQISKFLKLEPLNIDDTRKYKSCIYKPIGIFSQYYNENVLKTHYNRHELFYKKWGYLAGEDMRRYFITNQEINYLEFLNRNHVFSVDIPFNPNNGYFSGGDIIQRRINNKDKI